MEKNEGNEDGFFFGLLLQFVVVIIVFFSFFWCVCASSSLSFSLSFGVCVCVCCWQTDIFSSALQLLFLLIERVKEMRRIIIVSVCFLVFCCFFSLSFGAVF
jgi:hypothetical protein